MNNLDATFAGMALFLAVSSSGFAVFYQRTGDQTAMRKCRKAAVVFMLCFFTLVVRMGVGSH